MSKHEARELLFGAAMLGRVQKQLGRLGVPARERRDALQLVMLLAWQSFARIDLTCGKPLRWLNVIVVRQAQRARLAVAKRQSVRHLPRPRQVAQDELLDAARVRRMVDDLPPRLRAVLEHDLYGEHMEDIAAREGVSLTTAYRRRDHALARLRSRIDLGAAR